VFIRPTATTDWPELGDDPVITVTVTAGFAETPEPIVMAILLLAAHWFGNRETVGPNMSELPFTVAALLAPYRVQWTA
jgi:hypothetical protein